MAPDWKALQAGDLTIVTPLDIPKQEYCDMAASLMSGVFLELIRLTLSRLARPDIPLSHTINAGFTVDKVSSLVISIQIRDLQGHTTMSSLLYRLQILYRRR